MSLRLPLVVLAAVALTGCKLPLQEKQAAAPAAAADCCCKVCPTDAAPATKVAATGKTDSASASSTVRRETVRVVRHQPAPVRRERAERRYYASESSSETLAGGRYGGRYGVSGRAVSGVSVSVEESETYSERRRYSESTSAYGSRGYGAGSSYESRSGSGYAEGYGRGDRYSGGRDSRGGRDHPRPYHLAGTDREGYLTWPGKVED